MDRRDDPPGGAVSVRQVLIDGPAGRHLAAFERAGRGTPVLFLGGLLVPAASWLPVIAALPGRRCIALDYLGQGASAAIPGDVPQVPFATHLDDVLGAIARLVPGRCHVVGLSLGGMLGIEVALARPQVMASLCMISTSADGELAENLPGYRALIDGIAAGDLAGPLLEAVLKLYLSPAAYADAAADAPRAILTNYLTGMDRHAVVAHCRGIMGRPSRMRDLHRIQLPTLALIGEDDQIVSQVRLRATAALIPGCVVSSTADGGHIPSLERPIRTARIVCNFLDRMDTAVR